MNEHRFRLNNEDHILQLINLLTDENIQLDLTLVANVPEEFRRLINRHRQLNTLSRPLTKEEKAFQDSTSPQLMEVAELLKVLPFSTLECGFYIYSGPQLKHYGDRGLITPASILNGYRPYIVSFRDARERWHVQMIKDTVNAVVPDKYRIGSFRAGLDPNDWTHEYTGGTDYSAVLHLETYDGITITVIGMEPENIPMLRVIGAERL